jgi:class 3 adenylate cyclase
MIDNKGAIPMCFLPMAWSSSSLRRKSPDPISGTVAAPANLVVPGPVLAELTAEAVKEDSIVSCVISVPVKRTFVYLDVSDFSNLKPGQEALVINSIVGTVTDSSLWENLGQVVFAKWEAMLCIGDGYIFVFQDPMVGAYFAAYLAQLVEVLVANEELPVDFHFRMGVHSGEVYRFWDPGRQDWNYIGEGINGGNRVLAAVGKEQDDVVFISAQVRKAIIAVQSRQRSEAPRLLECLINRGRKADKHGNPWRVYELNHTSLCGDQMPMKYRREMTAAEKLLQLPMLTNSPIRPSLSKRIC